MASLILSLFIIGIIASTSMPSVVVSTPTTPVAGNTLIYKITQWSVPSDLSIFDNSSSSTGVTTNISLLGSALGLKVLSVGTSSYSYGLYLQAGSGPIQVTVPSTAINISSSTDLNILTPFLTATGDVVLSLPAGAALPIIPSESSSYSFSDGSGFWLKVSDWNTIKSDINATSGYSYTESGTTITITHTIADTRSTGNVSLTYTETADAIFTQLQFQLSVKDKTNVAHPVIVTLSYDHTDNNPLPSTLSTGNVLKYVVSTSSLVITTQLNSNTQSAIDLLFATDTNLSSSFGGATSLNGAISYLENQTSSQVGKTVAQYTITSINGAYYNASVITGSSTSSSNFMFNGFTGSSECISIGCESSSFAPVITPDFNMWNGIATDINTIGNIYVKVLSASTAGSYITGNYTAAGFTNGPNLAFNAGYTNQTGYKIYGAGGHIDFKYNSSTATTTTPSTSSVYLTLTSDVNGGIAVSNEGYVLAMGAKASADITFNAAISTGGSSSLPLQGSVQVAFEYKVKLSDQSTGVPSSIVNLANTANQNVDSSIAPLTSAPGFEFIPMIAGLAVLPLLVRRIKHTK